MRRILIATLLAIGAPVMATPLVIVSEDFESYADTAGLGGTWTLGDGTLDTAVGNPGQSLNHPGTGASFSGANTNTISFTGLYPGPGEKLILEGDIYDDALSNNERNTIGLRDSAGANIIEMGFYNNPSHYAIRTVSFASGSDSAWVAMPSVTPETPVEGWHTYKAVITDSDVTFTLDLGADGTVDSTYTATVAKNAAFNFNQIRLGGPSDLGSAGGGAKFDNISLTLVPEPTAGVLALVAMAATLRRRG